MTEFNEGITEFNESGSKYLREMRGLVDGKADVYAVLVSFGVTCPARQHAIKKLLFAGRRGKSDEYQDVSEARDAIDRALQLIGEPLAEAVSDKQQRLQRENEAKQKAPGSIKGDPNQNIADAIEFHNRQQAASRAR